MPTHLVEQGDHLSGIAEQYGYRDFQTLWDDAANSGLQDQGRKPHILLPGDTVEVPEPQRKTEDRATEARHRFRTPRRRLKLKLRLLTSTREPQKDTAVRLEVAGKSGADLTTDGDGKIADDDLPRRARIARLIVAETEFSVQIGHLDPSGTDSGWEGRLNNLGYFVPDATERDADEVRSAIEEFQCDYGLTVDGEKSDATKAKLEEVHGS